MQTSLLELVSLAFTWLVFGGLGYLYSKRFKQPIAIYSWALIVVVTFVLGSFFSSTAKLMSIFGFDIFVNWSIRAFGIGLIIGLLIQALRLHRVHATKT